MPSRADVVWSISDRGSLLPVVVLTVLALLFGQALSGAATMVTLNSATNPAAGDPAVINIGVTGHGFRAGPYRRPMSP
jgi:hypothetical protein